MIPILKRSTALLIPLLLAAGLWLWWQKRSQENVTPQRSAKPPTLSTLGRVPDWKSLEAHQGTITRSEFERLLTTVFVTGGSWREFMEIGENEVRIRTADGENAEVFVLRFANDGFTKTPARWWRVPEELPPAAADKPLDGLHIAIDPGHTSAANGRASKNAVSTPAMVMLCAKATSRCKSQSA